MISREYLRRINKLYTFETKEELLQYREDIATLKYFNKREDTRKEYLEKIDRELKQRSLKDDLKEKIFKAKNESEKRKLEIDLELLEIEEQKKDLNGAYSLDWEYLCVLDRKECSLRRELETL